MDIRLPEIATDLLLNIINIIILFVIVKAIVYKPVKKFLDERTARVKGAMDEAEKLSGEANEVLKQKDEILSSAKLEGDKLKKEALSEAGKNAENIINDAKETANKLKSDAEKEIKAEKENMLLSSKNEIADVAVSIAERILDREINEEDNKKIVDDFFGA